MNPSSRAYTLGFIGLGAMGLPMATNLYTKALNSARMQGAAELPGMVICELSDSAANAFMEGIRGTLGEEAAARIHRVDTPAQLAKEAARIFTMLPGTKQAEAVYLGQDGLVAGLGDANTSVTLSAAVAAAPWLGAVTTDSSSSSSHSLFIDSTTLDPAAAKRIAAAVHNLTHHGALVIDAPVSGGVVGAAAGALTIMFGADDPFATAMATPLLQYMAREGGVIACGGSGAGIGLKVCNNLVLAINQIALAEGLALSKALGLDAMLLHSVFNSSSAQSWSSRVNSPLPEVEGPGARGYEGGFPTSGMIKDVGLALTTARSVGLPTPLTKVAGQVYEAVAQYDDGRLAGKDFSVTYQWLNEMQGRD